MNLFQEYSGAIQAFATLFLVGITVYYAFQTKRTVKEMNKTRKMTFLPIISVGDISVAQLSNNNDYTLRAGIKIKNEGQGIARDVKIIFPLSQEMTFGAISVGKDNYGYFELNLENEVLDLPKEERYIIIKYRDIFNRQIITRALIEEVERDQIYKGMGINSWEIILPE
jgi:hypothetical protein